MNDILITDLKINAHDLAGNVQGIYFLFYLDELVYIGKGWNCFLRVAEHTRKDSDKIFSSWSFLPVEDKDEMKDLEKQLIQKHKPKYNVQHK